MILAAVEPAAIGETFLLTGESPLPWKDFYRAYETLLGMRSTVAMPAHEIRALRESGTGPHPFRVPSEHMLAFFAARSRLRIDKAKRLLGFRPAFDFAHGMQLTAQWARWAGLVPADARP
jgi:nucleoside-diphosphate-sugar epimerase